MRKCKPRGVDTEYGVFLENTVFDPFLPIHPPYHFANGVVLLFNLSNVETFEEAIHVNESIDGRGYDRICKLLVGNKIDLNDERRVRHDKAIEYAT